MVQSIIHIYVHISKTGAAPGIKIIFFFKRAGAGCVRYCRMLGNVIWARSFTLKRNVTPPPQKKGGGGGRHNP